MCYYGGNPHWIYYIFIQGYLRWLKDYLKIQKVYPEMGRDFGPRPLLLIRSFHFIMGLSFLITIL